MEIRSYRAVFDLERRIYRVDRLRLNPGGVPVRGIVYFAVIALCGACLAALPGASGVSEVLPWYVREVLMPGALSAVLALVKIDGRPFHTAALALLRHLAGSRLTLGCGRALPGERFAPGEMLLVPDGSDPHLRRMRYCGPGAVLVAVAHERRELRSGALRGLMLGPHLVICEMPGRTLTRPQVIELHAGGRLQVR